MLQTTSLNIYFISGLGADERTFQKLVLPPTWGIHYLPWLPADKNESLKDYCKKLSQLINTSEPFVVVGLSFGGVVAVELSKIIHPALTILISSVSTRQELPFIYKLIGASHIIKLIPAFLLTKKYPLTNWFFGMKSEAEKRLLKQIITSSSPAFYKWALNAILTWTNTTKPSGVFHIHGTADKIFPCRNTKADLLVKGGHFMVYSNAKTLSKIITEKIEAL